MGSWRIKESYDGHTFSIAWYDEDGEGLVLSNDKDLRTIKKEPAVKGGERWKSWLVSAEIAVMIQALVKLGEHDKYGPGGTTEFEFTSQYKAALALRAAKQAWAGYKAKVLKIKRATKAKPKAPAKKEPAWMAQARKAGWTPPKTKKR